MHLLYLSSILPKRSETFVYNELLGLRDRGNKVSAASLHAPDQSLGDPRLDQLAREAIGVYGPGMLRLFADALRFAMRRPLRALSVLGMAVSDAITATDVRGAGRLRVIIQGIAALALAQRISSLGVSHIHIHMAHAPATVGMYAAEALRIPFSFTGHAADLFRDRCLLLPKLKRAAFVACISHWHRSWYRSIMNREDAAYPIVRCGVEIPPNVATTDASPFSILGLGRLVPKKGFDQLIRALGILKKQGVAFQCTIAGDGPEAEALSALAQHEDVAGNVHFPGSVNHSDVPRLIASAHLVVLPCQTAADGDRDGIPVVLMEAMAHGVCVVSGDIPTIRELIIHDETGCMVPPSEYQILAEVIGKLIANDSLRTALGQAGRAFVMKEFSREENLDRILKAFHSSLR